MGAADVFDQGRKDASQISFMQALIKQTRQLHRPGMDKLFTLLLLWLTRELGESAFYLCHPPPAHQSVVRVVVQLSKLILRITNVKCIRWWCKNGEKPWLGAASPQHRRLHKDQRENELSHTSSDEFYRSPWAAGKPFQSVKVIENFSFLVQRWEQFLKHCALLSPGCFLQQLIQQAAKGWEDQCAVPRAMPCWGCAPVVLLTSGFSASLVPLERRRTCLGYCHPSWVFYHDNLDFSWLQSQSSSY